MTDDDATDGQNHLLPLAHVHGVTSESSVWSSLDWLVITQSCGVHCAQSHTASVLQLIHAVVS